MYVLPFFSLFIVTTAKVMFLFDTSKQFISFFEKGNNFLLLAIFRVWNVTKIIKKEEDQGSHQKR